MFSHALTVHLLLLHQAFKGTHQAAALALVLPAQSLHQPRSLYQHLSGCSWSDFNPILEKVQIWFCVIMSVLARKSGAT